jgi:ribosome biogenesis GTPase A
MSSLRRLEKFVEAYKAEFIHEVHFDDTIYGEIKQVQAALLDDKFLPSIELKTLFDKLLRRCKYPMEVAIVGQFSSGKSTFLNALLSKDVLPTGITPVTSKVNFINYGDEYKLKVTYKNGADEYRTLENIGKFTDQRKEIEDIKYLTLYAPMDILRDISFVDTPGLNSQSLSDTEVTKKILRDVDGIIWLTLIDNAGKESESKVLVEYLKNFQDKSLCVLNQKDKFSEEQIATTVSYINEKFASFFAKVIPISAKQALDSRVNQKEVLTTNALHDLQKSFNLATAENIDAKNLDFFNEAFLEFQQEIETIKKEDRSNDTKMMGESNISEVVTFIEEVIRPKAADAKAYAIRQDLSSLCDILIKENETILGVYESLEGILRHKEEEILEAFNNVYLKHSKSLYVTYDKVEGILESISNTIYQNIKSKKATRYQVEKGFLGKEVIRKHEYDSIFIDSEAISQKLFFENQLIDKQIKATMAHFRNIELDSCEDFRGVFRILKHAVQAWQEPYELIKKHRQIASDLEFANTRQFVAKVYENVLLSYHRAILGNIRALHKKFAFFNGAISFSYRQITAQSVSFYEEKLNKQIKMHEKDPLKYSISIPSNEAILETVKTNFTFDKVDKFLTSRRNYLYKIVETSKTQFSEINADRILYIISQKQLISQKIEAIKQIQLSIK